ncbi:MAG: hypothetical protein NTY09_09175 [bacterium]|nr:hypothetical protein [bacterium]
MFKRQKLIFTGLWIISVVVFIVTPSCAGRAGKSLSRDTMAFQQETAPDSGFARPSIANSTAQSEKTLPTREPSEHDPFGYFPLGWISDCPLHPECYVGYSGIYGQSGLYIVTLISQDQATGPGVQSFHIESLAGWDSIQVSEGDEDEKEDGTESEKLTIVADRPDAELVIITEVAVPGFVASLDHADFWLNLVGPTPLVTRYFYTPLN